MRPTRAANARRRLPRESLQDPLAFLELAEVFTPPLRESARFRDAFAHAAGSLAELGPLGAIERLAERADASA